MPRLRPRPKSYYLLFALNKSYNVLLIIIRRRIYFKAFYYVSMLDNVIKKKLNKIKIIFDI